MKVYQKSTEDVKEIIKKTEINMLYEKASQGLMELSVSLGLEVLQMMLEENVEQYARPRGKHNTPERTGYRHGIEDTTVVMGGQKVRVKRPRRVSNFKNGATALRYAAAGFMEAEHGFRRIKGYRQLPLLNDILMKHISHLSETVSA